MRELAGMLADLSDEDLIAANRGLIAVCGLDSNANVQEVWSAMRDFCKEERFHRREVIWFAESDLRGGHHVYLDTGGDGMLRAHCSPYHDECWRGPGRDSVSEALDDGRRHHPGYEPKLAPWWQQAR